MGDTSSDAPAEAHAGIFTDYAAQMARPDRSAHGRLADLRAAAATIEPSPVPQVAPKAREPARD